MADDEKPSEKKSTGAKKAPAERLEKARERFTEIASGVEQTVRSGAGKASDQLKAGAGRASEVAREKIAVAKEGVRHGYERVSKDFDHLVQDVNDYVRQNPGKSVLMAAAAGFFLGLLLRGRRD